jgi:chorismate mutase
MNETSKAIHDLTELIGHYHIQEVKLSTERCDYYLTHLLAIVAERDALAAEVAALKAHDPLAEMWRELEEYQPMADRDGHGESWAKMCSERSMSKAYAARDKAMYRAGAASDAASDAAYAAWAASSASQYAHTAIAAIRRAKEAK